MQGISVYISRAFLNTKLMQTDSKFAIIFFLLICILMRKELNKLGDFNYIYKSLNVFYASNPLVAFILTILQNISDFQMIEA